MQRPSCRGAKQEVIEYFEKLFSTLFANKSSKIGLDKLMFHLLELEIESDILIIEV